MEKYLVTIEFRYTIRSNEDEVNHFTKKITLGVFDDFDQACKIGNENLEILESKYKLNPNWNTKERFSKNGGCFGSKKTLITNLAYLQTPFSFYAKIDTLKYGSVNDLIDEYNSKKL